MVLAQGDHGVLQAEGRRDPLAHQSFVVGRGRVGERDAQHARAVVRVAESLACGDSRTGLPERREDVLRREAGVGIVAVAERVQEEPRGQSRKPRPVGGQIDEPDRPTIAHRHAGPAREVLDEGIVLAELASLHRDRPAGAR